MGGYPKVKAALLRRFRFTVEGFREIFRSAKSVDGETAAQFSARLCHYIDRWVEPADVAKDYWSLRELLIKEQFLSSCHPDLALYLKERRAESFKETLELADRCLYAQGGSNLGTVRKGES